jgi:type II secretory pathway pseudopilin PulG
MAAVDTRARRRCQQHGYVLLTLLLLLSLLVIAAATVAPTIAFEIRRDREEEMIHRGVQYSRAIRSYAKKTGRYPATLDQLENSSNIRFMRKLYKDPLTGKNFRLLHLGDIPSATTATNLNASSLKSKGGEAPGDATSTDPGSTASPASDGESVAPADKTDVSQLAPNDSRVNSVGQVIFGVASTSKARTIREFDHKNHYNEWLFFYDPARDRGSEIKGPTPLTNALPLPGNSLQKPTPLQPPAQQ